MYVCRRNCNKNTAKSPSLRQIRGSILGVPLLFLSVYQAGVGMKRDIKADLSFNPPNDEYFTTTSHGCPNTMNDG